MKIHKVSGCIAFSLNVDGKEETNMTDNERLEVIDKIYEWMKRHPDNLNYVLQGLADMCGEYNVIDSTPCECCGDIVDEMMLDLDA